MTRSSKACARVNRASMNQRDLREWDARYDRQQWREENQGPPVIDESRELEREAGVSEAYPLVYGGGYGPETPDRENIAAQRRARAKQVARIESRAHIPAYLHYAETLPPRLCELHLKYAKIFEPLIGETVAAGWDRRFARYRGLWRNEQQRLGTNTKPYYYIRNGVWRSLDDNHLDIEPHDLRYRESLGPLAKLTHRLSVYGLRRRNGLENPKWRFRNAKQNGPLLAGSNEDQLPELAQSPKRVPQPIVNMLDD